MTDEELYGVLTNDSTAEKYLSNNDYKSLFKYIFSQYRDVKPKELTALLLNAGIDIFEDGEIPYTMYMGDKTLFILYHFYIKIFAENALSDIF